jgi:glutathione synthase/RimK-type ligase-like ATP-grasp enzyme
MLLILTEKFDPHADFVQVELDERCVPWRRLHLSDFPNLLELTVSVQDGVLNLRGADPYSGVFTDEQIRAIWNRRREAPNIPGHYPADVSRFIKGECTAFLESLWVALGELPWIPPTDAIRRASSELEQLRRAQCYGLRTPRTCVTNAPAAVKSFIQDLGDERVIYKTLSSNIFRRPDGTCEVVYSSLVSIADLDRFTAGLDPPGIFQQWIRKRYDYRVTVVGDRVFPCRIRSQELDSTATDVRASPWGEAGPLHEAVDLPTSLSAACADFVHGYGLNFEAIDIVEDEEGEFYFIELNPNGQWAWIQHRTGLPIREALVDLIVGVMDLPET